MASRKGLEGSLPSSFRPRSAWPRAGEGLAFLSHATEVSRGRNRPSAPGQTNEAGSVEDSLHSEAVWAGGFGDACGGWAGGSWAHGTPARPRLSGFFVSARHVQLSFWGGKQAGGHQFLDSRGQLDHPQSREAFQPFLRTAGSCPPRRAPKQRCVCSEFGHPVPAVGQHATVQGSQSRQTGWTRRRSLGLRPVLSAAAGQGPSLRTERVPLVPGFGTPRCGGRSNVRASGSARQFPKGDREQAPRAGSPQDLPQRGTAPRSDSRRWGTVYAVS